MLASDISASGAGLFGRPVPPGGYAWWYIDAISHDSEFAITLIAFIGSVFSPYYAWSGRAEPLNHCALNVALYGRHHRRWTMTERGRAKVDVAPDRLAIGASSLNWAQDGLTIDIAEHAMPLPFPVRGQVRLTPRCFNEQLFQIDRTGQHKWRPVLPLADVEVRLQSPDLTWQGQGYFDMNFGDTPLEHSFCYWDWSRVHTRDGMTGIAYNIDARDGTQQQLGLKFLKDGTHERLDPQPETDLARTSIFRIRRRTRPFESGGVQLGSTLEDTPFYSRSTIDARFEGQPALGVHESFDGDRLKQTLVKMMLPFRMPRRA